ncbi:MAG: pantoate--beta-alanine ligase [Fidelibacterota bacterium]
MRVVKTIDEIRKVVSTSKKKGKRIGLVPTMGYFHEGHLSLIDFIRPHADVVVVSLFVNPTQFGPNEDLERYPRDFSRDERLAAERGADILFYPAAEEMYPQPFFTYVVTENLSRVLCGKSRPTHFRGVATIVTKLFNIVQPDVAVFGRKDAQQAIIIRRMTEDLNFPVKILIAPIVRESDGLAMSSRNTYLSASERSQAPVIYQALQQARKMTAGGIREAEVIQKAVREKIETAPLARIEYIEIVREADLKQVAQVEPDVFLAVAVWFGKTRLIDNVELRL